MMEECRQLRHKANQWWRNMNTGAKCSLSLRRWIMHDYIPWKRAYLKKRTLVWLKWISWRITLGSSYIRLSKMCCHRVPRWINHSCSSLMKTIQKILCYLLSTPSIQIRRWEIRRREGLISAHLIHRWACRRKENSTSRLRLRTRILIATNFLSIGWIFWKWKWMITIPRRLWNCKSSIQKTPKTKYCNKFGKLT